MSWGCLLCQPACFENVAGAALAVYAAALGTHCPARPRPIKAGLLLLLLHTANPHHTKFFKASIAAVPSQFICAGVPGQAPAPHPLTCNRPYPLLLYCLIVTAALPNSICFAQVYLDKPLGVKFARGNDGGAYVVRR